MVATLVRGVHVDVTHEEKHAQMKKNSDFIEIFLGNACRFKKRLYLCNRNRETTIASEN